MIGGQFAHQLSQEIRKQQISISFGWFSFCDDFRNISFIYIHDVATTA